MAVSEVQIPAAYWDYLLRLNEDGIDDGGEQPQPGLSVEVDLGSESTSLTLDLDGVRALRLACQRFERKHR